MADKGKRPMEEAETSRRSPLEEGEIALDVPTAKVVRREGDFSVTVGGSKKASKASTISKVIVFRNKESKLFLQQEVYKYIVALTIEDIEMYMSTKSFRNQLNFNIYEKLKTMYIQHPKHLEGHSLDDPIVEQMLMENIKGIEGTCGRDFEKCLAPWFANLPMTAVGNYKTRGKLFSQLWKELKDVEGSTGKFVKAPTLTFLQAYQIKLNYERNLGEGAHARAYFCYIRTVKGFDPKKKYVAKLISTSSGDQSRQRLAYWECGQGQLAFPGIVRAIALCNSPTRPIIIFQYWNGGPLVKWMSLDRCGTEKETSYYVRSISHKDYLRLAIYQRCKLDIANAILLTLVHMHKNGVLHNDLHAANFVLHFEKTQNKDDPQRKVFVGIIDWGMAG